MGVEQIKLFPIGKLAFAELTQIYERRSSPEISARETSWFPAPAKAFRRILAKVAFNK